MKKLLIKLKEKESTLKEFIITDEYYNEFEKVNYLTAFNDFENIINYVLDNYETIKEFRRISIINDAISKINEANKIFDKDDVIIPFFHTDAFNPTKDEFYYSWCPFFGYLEPFTDFEKSNPYLEQCIDTIRKARNLLFKITPIKVSGEIRGSYLAFCEKQMDFIKKSVCFELDFNELISNQVCSSLKFWDFCASDYKKKILYFLNCDDYEDGKGIYGTQTVKVNYPDSKFIEDVYGFPKNLLDAYRRLYGGIGCVWQYGTNAGSSIVKRVIDITKYKTVDSANLIAGFRGYMREFGRDITAEEVFLIWAIYEAKSAILQMLIYKEDFNSESSCGPRASFEAAEVLIKRVEAEDEKRKERAKPYRVSKIAQKAREYENIIEPRNSFLIQLAKFFLKKEIIIKNGKSKFEDREKPYPTICYFTEFSKYLYKFFRKINDDPALRNEIAPGANETIFNSLLSLKESALKKEIGKFKEEIGIESIRSIKNSIKQYENRKNT